MNESEERYVDALEKDIKNYEKQIKELTSALQESEKNLVHCEEKCDLLQKKSNYLSSYRDGVRDAIMLVQGGVKSVNVCNEFVCDE